MKTYFTSFNTLDLIIYLRCTYMDAQGISDAHVAIDAHRNTLREPAGWVAADKLGVF